MTVPSRRCFSVSVLFMFLVELCCGVEWNEWWPEG
jgi:hypothetical protein